MVQKEIIVMTYSDLSSITSLPNFYMKRPEGVSGANTCMWLFNSVCDTQYTFVWAKPSHIRL